MAPLGTRHASRLAGIAACLLLASCGGGSSPVSPTTRTFDVPLSSLSIILARHAALLPQPASALVEMPAAPEGPFRYIDASQTLWVNPDQTRRVELRYLAPADGAGPTVASVASSDTTVATVSSASASAGGVSLDLTGAVGNAFVTMYDANGSAVEKVMILAARPLENVVVVDTDAFEPYLIRAGSAQGTDFRTAYSGEVLSDLTNPDTRPTDQNPYRFVIRQKDGGPFDASRLSKVAVNLDAARALYFPVPDVLIQLNPGDSFRHATTSGDRMELSINSLVTQDRWLQFMDDGGNLSSSPLRDPGQTVEGSMDVLVPPGKTFEELGGGFDCRGSLFPRLSSVLLRMKVGFEGTFRWVNGRADIRMGVKPQVGSGGQLSLEATTEPLEAICRIELYRVIVAELRPALIGKIGLYAPVGIGFEATMKGSAPGSATLVLPRIELGSGADPTQPGFVGVRFQYGLGPVSTYDLGLRTWMDAIGLVKGSSPITGNLKVKMGAYAGLYGEAYFNLYFTKLWVTAHIGDVLFGPGYEYKYTVKTVGGKTRFDLSTGEGFYMGIYPHFDPTITITLGYFRKSWNLFQVDFADIVLKRGMGKRGDILDQKLMLSLDGYPDLFRFQWPRTGACTEHPGFAYVNDWMMSDRWLIQEALGEKRYEKVTLRIFAKDTGVTVLEQDARIPWEYGQGAQLNLAGIDFEKIRDDLGGQELLYDVLLKERMSIDDVLCTKEFGPRSDGHSWITLDL